MLHPVGEIEFGGRLLLHTCLESRKHRHVACLSRQILYDEKGIIMDNRESLLMGCRRALDNRHNGTLSEKYQGDCYPKYWLSDSYHA